MEEQLALAWIRQNSEKTDILEPFPSLNAFFSEGNTFADYCNHIHKQWSPYGMFAAELDSGIEIDTLNQWFGSTAPLWVRAAKGKSEKVEAFFQRSDLTFTKLNQAYMLALGSKIDDAVANGLCYIQDFGSQTAIPDDLISKHSKILDVCCGAGGKSLRIAEAMNENAFLWITDKRDAIVQNAIERFKVLQYQAPVYGVNDLNKRTTSLDFNLNQIKSPFFDLVVCDVPCSGSGTWRRNPEALRMYIENKTDYSPIQYNIALHSAAFMKAGGTLLYLTCSVFKSENSDNVRKICKDGGFELESETYCGTAENNADYLYRAILKKL
jgi:16S rRNA (cytosine967-C5)-methyltransferase